MTSIEKIKELHRHRGALRSKLTRFVNYIDRPSIEQDLIELKRRLMEIESIKLNFENIQSEIESLVLDDEVENEYVERGNFEEKLTVECAKAQRLIIDREPVTQVQVTAPSISGDSTSHVGFQNEIRDILSRSNNENMINIKLPALNLPKFSGSYEKWPGFSDTFKSSVHNDRRYTDSQKLIYLRSCLAGKAADKIESLETTDANYSVAWKILEKYYDDPVAVINNHIQSIFDLTSCQNASATNLGDLLDNVTKHYRALEALNKPFLESFPIYAVTSKLDFQTRLKWKEHIRENTAPTMEDLLDFLHVRQKILETNKHTVRNEKLEKYSRKDHPNYTPPGIGNLTHIINRNPIVQPYRMHVSIGIY